MIETYLSGLNNRKFNYSKIDLTLPKKLKQELVEKQLVTAMMGMSIPIKEIDALLVYLNSTDFYTAPASTRFHENFVGGLLDHSIKVMNTALTLYDNPVYSLPGVTADKIVVAALLHDLCKVDYYSPTKKSIKNPKTGTWETIDTWEVRQDRPVTLGHGEQSCILLLTKVPSLDLSVVEAIRWHMGLWEPCNQSDYSKSFARNPLVSLIQFSDAISVSDWLRC